jgi:hypothetical protein
MGLDPGWPAQHCPDDWGPGRRARAGHPSPGGPGAVLILDLPDQVAAERITSEFPLVAAGLITTEVIPLHPLDF